MGLIQLGPIVSNVSGKVGGVVFSRNRGGAYAKTFTVPTQPNTPRQIAARGALALAARRWVSTITNAQRETWENYAASTPVINRLGDERFLTGQQFFVRDQSYFQSPALFNTLRELLTTAPTANGFGPTVVSVAGAYVLNTGILTLTINSSSSDLENGYVLGGGPYTQNYTRNPGDYRVYVNAVPVASSNMLTATFLVPNLTASTDYRLFYRIRLFDSSMRVGEDVEAYVDFTTPSS